MKKSFLVICFFSLACLGMNDLSSLLNGNLGDTVDEQSVAIVLLSERVDELEKEKSEQSKLAEQLNLEKMQELETWKFRSLILNANDAQKWPNHGLEGVCPLSFQPIKYLRGDWYDVGNILAHLIKSHHAHIISTSKESADRKVLLKYKFDVCQENNEEQFIAQIISFEELHNQLYFKCKFSECKYSVCGNSSTHWRKLIKDHLKEKHDAEILYIGDEAVLFHRLFKKGEPRYF